MCPERCEATLADRYRTPGHEPVIEARTLPFSCLFVPLDDFRSYVDGLGAVVRNIGGRPGRCVDAPRIPGPPRCWVVELAECAGGDTAVLRVVYDVKGICPTMNCPLQEYSFT